MADQYSDLVQQYHRDGFVVLRNVIDQNLIEECEQHTEYLQKKHPSMPNEHLHRPIMCNDPFWVRLVSDQRLLDLATIFGTLFIKPDEGIVLFSSHYFCKPPKTGIYGRPYNLLWYNGLNYPLISTTASTRHQD